MLKKIPLPIVGVMLGMAALGNLIQSYSENIRLLFGTISLVLGIVFILNVLSNWKSFTENMKNPIMASVFCTFPMAIVLLSGYAKQFIGESAKFIYYGGLAIHGVVLIYFTIRFIFNFDFKKVFASYYIVYVGMVVGSVVAPAFEAMILGKNLFWIGFILLLALLVVVNYRYIKYKEIPEPAQSLFAITTAPASLCLAGYIQSFEQKSMGIVLFLAILSQILYILVLTKMPKFLKLKFYPSMAAFTFPFVITAISLKMLNVFLLKSGAIMAGDLIASVLGILVLIETFIACILCLYTLFRFCMVIISSDK